MGATDYEVVDVFNWQEEAVGMISQMEFVWSEVVQSISIEQYAKEYGWQLIDDKNRKELFMKMAEQMDMSYSYKPVLLKAILKHVDKNGRVKIEDIVGYFKNFYESRRAAGLIVEKSNSIFAKGGYTDKEAERNILSNPFKRFEDMNMLRHTKTLGIIEVDSVVWKKLTEEDKQLIVYTCNERLKEYYKLINRNY